MVSAETKGSTDYEMSRLRWAARLSQSSRGSR